MHKHTQSSLKPPLHCGKKKKANRPQPQPPHRRGTFHRRLQPLYTEKRKVSCFGFLPKTEPMQHHAASTLRSATTDSKHPITTHTTSTPKTAWSHRYNAARKKANRPQPQPPHRRGTFHRRLQPLYTEKHKVSCSGFLPKTEPLQHHAAITMRSEGTDSKTPYNYAHTSTPNAAWSHRYNAAKKRQTDRSRNRRTDEVPFIAGCSHFTRKNTRFLCFGFLPKTEPMQHHAAITMRSATTDSKTPYNYACTSTPKAAWNHRYNAAKEKGKPTAAATAAQTRYLSSPAAATLHGKTQGFVLRLPPQNRALATFMQPFQCDLQPQLQQTHRTTHTGTTIVAKHIEGTKRPQPHPPHTRGTFHRRLQPLYTKNTRFRALASSPQHCPCNIHAAMTMRSEGTDSKTPYNYQAQAHPKQLEATVTMRQEKGKPTAAATAAQTRYLSSPAAATLHGKTQGFVLRLPPENRAHATSCSHYNAICNHRFQNTL